ncbi:TonB-dependent receptor, partial [candidate division KSB1 bacterium]|nr:TonB-dependent receptor [candidate division KSB1 bacterium]
NLGAASGLDGYYIIRGLPAGAYTLRASMIGYEIAETTVVVSAQTETSADFVLKESIIEMHEIVVTATGLPQLYQNTPVKTAIVSRDMIVRQKVNNLAEAIDFQTGVRVESNCQNCNFTQVRLLGLEGHHTQILIDSDPVVSSLAGVYGLEQLPQEMIERVEIVKGGGSSLYGGQAIAGVVNLITRRPTYDNFSLDYSNGSIEKSMDHRVGGTLSHVSDGAFKSVLFGAGRQRQPYDHNGDGLSEIGWMKSEAVGGNMFFTPTERCELAMQFHYIHEDRRGGNKFELAPHEADIAEWTNMRRYGATLSWTQRPTPLFDYKLYASSALTNRDSYYGAEQDANAYGQTNNPLMVGGIRSSYLMGRHTFIAGLQFSEDEIKDEAPAYGRTVDESYSNIGLFLQDSYKAGAREKSEVVYGVRLDDHSAIRSIIVSPRVAFKSSLSNSLVCRGGYSTGFKAPQVFDEDLHITQVGGEGQIIRNRPDLRQERGHTFYGGLEYQGIVDALGVRVGINAYYTKLYDIFLLSAADDPATDEFEFYRTNGAGSRVRGVELEFGLRCRTLELLTGITVQSSLLDESEPNFGATTIFRTPDVYGSARCSYELSDQLNLMLTAKYTGSMIVPHYAGYIAEDRLERTKTFLTLDLIVSYAIPLGSLVGTLSGGVYNILNHFQDDFDLGIHRDAGYVYGPLVPRRILVGFTVGYEKKMRGQSAI